jgi:hypothetical protein
VTTRPRQETTPVIPVGDARDAAALRATLRWSLTAAGWERLIAALARADDALCNQDAAAFRRAVGDVQRSGPTRVATRLGAASAATPTSPAPDRVHELVNRMIDSLEVPPEPPPAPRPPR